MALLHQAELRPSKTELLDGWAPSQLWYQGEAGVDLVNVASFRFDDPDGEVGIETLLVRAGNGPLLQVPLTYRNAPLAGADAWLIGTMQHSALGKRWVYDAVGDPVYLQATVTAALNGGHQAELLIEIDGEMVRREPTAVVAGSGSHGMTVALPSVDQIAVSGEKNLSVVEAGPLQLVLARVVDEAELPETLDGAAEGKLSGTWAGQSESQPLVLASTR